MPCVWPAAIRLMVVVGNPLAALAPQLRADLTECALSTYV